VERNVLCNSQSVYPNTMKLIAHFAANYRVDFEAELPGERSDVLAFSQRNPRTDSIRRDGPLVKVVTDGSEAWFATFANGDRSGPWLECAFTTPDPDCLCVVAHGAGYWVHVRERTKEDVPIFPIRQFKLFNDGLLLADFTSIARYDASGLAWRSERLISDRLDILSVSETDRIIVCSGWDAASAHEAFVQLDLLSGRRLS
jgi:hypothetical protein